MRKAYTLLLALGVAAASLTSCSKSTYSFNSTPAYLGSQPVAVAKAAPVAPAAEATEVAVAPATNVTKPEPAVVATKPAPAAVAAPVAAAAEAAPVAAKAAKPSLVQRVLINKLAKELAKVSTTKAKQAAASLENTDKTQSMRKTSVLLIVGGAIALIVGLIIAASSTVNAVNGSGDGGGFGFGILLYILGAIALTVGVILLIVSLVRGK